MIQGFEPYVNADSEILILGSFPSVKSREQKFYYGNSQNRFWRILAESFSAPVPESIEDKKSLLRANKVALWDVVLSCEIVGSMDKDIKQPRIADVSALVAKYPIRKIITNGSKAKALLLAHFPELEKTCIFLGSTSPANARLNKQTWIDALRGI